MLETRRSFAFYIFFFESVSFERYADDSLFFFFFLELYRVRWMMYGKFSFFRILHTCTNEAKIL